MNNILLDGFMVTLLFMAIIFCWRLNKRLMGMKQMGTQLTPFIRNFSSYLTQITQSIDKLKETSEIGHKGLSEQIPQALSLKDDFDILLEHSDKIAKRLDQVIEKAQQTEKLLQQTLQMATRSHPGAFPSEPIKRTPSLSASKTTYESASVRKEQEKNFSEEDFIDEPLRNESNGKTNSREFAIDRGLMSVLRGMR